MDSKDTNPKDAVGTAKVPVSTLSFQVMAEVGLAMLEGARKYGRHNYRVSGVRASVYFDAVFRHLGAWWEGEDVDPASGLSHVTKAIAGLMVLRDSMLQGNWVDDRPPRVEKDFIARLNALAKDIIERTPDPKPAYTATPRLNALMEESDRTLRTYHGRCEAVYHSATDNHRCDLHATHLGPHSCPEPAFPSGRRTWA